MFTKLELVIGIIGWEGYTPAVVYHLPTCRLKHSSPFINLLLHFRNSSRTFF
jgi:hypothetical protein